MGHMKFLAWFRLTIFDEKFYLDRGKEGRVSKTVLNHTLLPLTYSFRTLLSLAENIFWSCRHFRSLHSRAQVQGAGSVKYFEILLCIPTWVEALIMLKKCLIIYVIQLAALPAAELLPHPIASLLAARIESP